MTGSSSGNTSTGVFARLIENWLTNTPERGFEVPFCQLLQSEGYRIVHIDSHSQQEEGKDILAVDPQNRLCGYALKRGDIDVTRWRREVLDELHELVELAVQHPSFNGQMCVPFLVVTGTLNQPALSRLRAFNATLRNRSHQEVTLIDRHNLFDRFRQCQDTVLPTEPADFQTFLELAHVDGRTNLDRQKFAHFLDGLLPDNRPLGSVGEIKRRFAGVLLLAAHAMNAHVRADNHLAEAEAWTFAAARLARAAAAHRVATKHWQAMMSLAIDAAVQALHRLADEAIANQELQPSDPMGDGGWVWRARATMVCGAVAASRLLRRKQARPDPVDEKPFLTFVTDHLRHLFLWGESAASYFFLIYWYLHHHPGLDVRAENVLAFGYVRNIALANTKRGVANRVANPYYPPDECVRRAIGVAEEPILPDRFRNVSYTVLPAVYLLMRALRRQALSMIWYDVVDLAHYQVDFDNSADFLRYRARGVGTWRSVHLPRPTSWTWLKSEDMKAVTRAEACVPMAFRLDERLPLLFALCHPHRLTPEFTLWISEQLLSE